MSFDVRNRRVVVVGAGRSGRAAARLLRRAGAEVTLDRHRRERTGPAKRIFERWAFAWNRARIVPNCSTSADLVVLSPGVPPAQPAIEAARRAGVPVIGEVELASRWLAGRVIAITGTKGKSTTTTLTARMLQEGGFEATAGGNLGTALSGRSPAHAPTRSTSSRSAASSSRPPTRSIRGLPCW